MAISKLQPVTTSSVSAIAAVPGASSKQYTITRNFSAGVYVITVSDSTVATVEFGNSSAIVLNATTVNGTVTVSLASDCTYAVVTLRTSASASVQINQTASTLVSTELSGTLDTITTSGTYSQTGKLYVLCVGGGGGGGGGGINAVASGGTGGSTVGKLVYTTSPTTVTIGNGGTGGLAASNSTGHGTFGGTTSFGSLVSAPGGQYGLYDEYENRAAAIPNYWQTVKSGTTGGGETAGNSANPSRGPAGGSGIGTGGAGGNSTNRNGQNGSGYGSGGGSMFGTSAGGGTGGNGAPGVIYVLRNF